MEKRRKMRKVSASHHPLSMITSLEKPSVSETIRKSYRPLTHSQEHKSTVFTSSSVGPL